MSDLRLKAKEILKIKQLEKEIATEKTELSLEELIKHKKTISRIEFKAYINKLIEDFQYRLLESANRGESLKIEILSIEKNLFKENNSVKPLMKYFPIQQKIATFLEDTSFEFLADEIIVDETLQKLYEVIVHNGIYPEWKVEESVNGKETVLYLEISPLNGYEERKAELKRKVEQRKQIERHAVVLYQQNIEAMQREQKKERLKNFIFIFLMSLYLSVVVLTVLTGSLGLFAVEHITNTFGLIALAWPYFLFTGLKSVFIVSLPLGLLFSLYLATKKS